MKSLFAMVAVATLFIFSGCQPSGSSGNFSAIERGFVTPPDSIQTSVYWYWINDNISKEAVVKDLQSMKQVGINRAFIGNIGLTQREYPYGNTKLFTDEWWKVMHAALKTATELGIDIGIFNCPGWSQSGGPWIKPEQAMRYLASSEIQVKGPQKLSKKLDQPTKEFQDIKVLAWPVAKNCMQNLFDMGTVSGPINKFMNEARVEITLKLPQPSTARSLIVYPEGHFYSECELQAKIGNEFKTIRKFAIDRRNTALNVGFEPLAPVAVSFPEVILK